jgi:hypothetical protein
LDAEGAHRVCALLAWVFDSLKKDLPVPHPFARYLGEWVGFHEVQRHEFMRSKKLAVTHAYASGLIALQL